MGHKKGKSVRNKYAKDLRTPKYKMRVVKSKKNKPSRYKDNYNNE